MSKEKTVPTEFPVVIDGKTTWTNRSDYAKHVASNMAIKLKADIKSSHIKEMLEALEKGVKELNAEAPDEIKQTFEKVQSDWDEALTKIEDDKKAEADAKAEEERLKKEAEAKEEQLFLSVKDETSDFATLGKLFDTGENMDRFVAKKDVDDKTLLTAFRTGLGMKEFTNWMTGDLAVALQDRGHTGVITKLAEAAGVPYVNIYNASKTARNVPPSQRKPGVSYTIYATIANAKFSTKEDEHAKKLGELVEHAGDYNSQTVRDAVKKAQGKADAPVVHPEENPKFDFIVVQENGTVNVTCGFPKALYDGGATVINPKTLKMFGSFKAKPENRWTDLPIYKAPEPKSEPEKPAAPAKGKGKK